MRLGRREFAATALSLATARPVGACGLLPEGRVPAASTPAMPYVDPGVLARLPFGTRSHWLQPWREASGTIPAAQLSAALGAVIEDVTIPSGPAMVETLARHGLRHLRIEIGWGSVDHATESRFVTEGSIRRLLLACGRARVRPLILLNAHHARPVPHRIAEVRLANPVAAGDQTLLVTGASRILPRLTGITDPVEKVMAGLMVIEAEGGRLRLSKPFPQALPAGARLELATLRYEPFSEPGTERNEATLAGWLRYVDLVADLAGAILTPQGGADRGFDLEVWNELTFGSQFLSIGRYYDPKLAPAQAQAQEEAVWIELAARTAAHVAAEPVRFAGVALTNGLASTIPWVASSRQHPRISAISKHPYPPVRNFPQDGQRGITALGPDGRPTGFEPSYTAFFPEYGATAIQTETLLRDVSPTPNAIYGVMHGRLARQDGGVAAPVDVWLTELGVNPSELGVTDRRAAARLKTKFCLRAALFHIGIGVARVYLFNAVGSPAEFALVDATLPGSATPVLRALARSLALIRGPGEGPAPKGPPRPLSFSVHRSEADARPIFAGGGPNGPPPLLGSDSLVLLPFQQASGCLAIVYYVMTRDLREDWPPERMRVQVTGLGRIGAVQAIDPVTDQQAPCRAARHRGDGLLLDLEVTDTPRILVIECATGMERADAGARHAPGEVRPCG